jgi:hypothetical protein
MDIAPFNFQADILKCMNPAKAFFTLSMTIAYSSIKTPPFTRRFSGRRCVGCSPKS